MKKATLYFAEALGTFTLVFVGAGSYLIAVSGAGIGLLGVALAHGLALMMAVYILGPVSGAHVNPAVTFGMWISGKMDTRDAVGYVIAQLLGATFAAVGLSLLLIGPETAALGTPAIAKEINMWQGLFLEAIFTFFLVSSVLATTEKKFPAGANGALIGMTLTAGVLVIGALTGGALNPARAFGPAAVSGTWMNHVVYWAGPLLGALVAALVNKMWKK